MSKRNKKPKQKIDYPTFRRKGHPTPTEKLVICDKCNSAHWTIHSDIQSYCLSCSARMRQGSKQEYIDAELAIEIEI